MSSSTSSTYTPVVFAVSAAVVLFKLRWLANRSGSVDCSVTGTLRIGTRKSDLAMVQTRHVESLIGTAFPGLKIEVQEGVNAMGDQVLDQSLKDLAAKSPGLFTTELEMGLKDGQYDAVVHSLKDMPTTLPPGLVLAAITEREDPRDALVVHATYRGLGVSNSSEIEREKLAFQTDLFLFLFFVILFFSFGRAWTLFRKAEWLARAPFAARQFSSAITLTWNSSLFVATYVLFVFNTWSLGHQTDVI